MKNFYLSIYVSFMCVFVWLFNSLTVLLLKNCFVCVWMFLGANVIFPGAVWAEVWVHKRSV